MKKIIFLKSLFLLSLILTGSLAANAHDFEVDGIYYNIINNNEVAVTFEGSFYYSSSNEYSGDVVIPEIVTYEGTSYTVTGIYQLAFAYCGSLTNITLPNTLTSIGNSAFFSCDQLSEVSFPSQLTSIENLAFCNCSTLTRIVIPRNLVSIGSNVFSHCAKVTSIEVENGNPNYDSRNNCNAIIETASNTIVRGCENTVIPNSITTIGNYAFDGCYGLETIDIPNSVTSIGYWAFRYCKGLTSITIPNSITVIEDYLFYGCISLATINIPNTIERIGYRAFDDTAWFSNQPDGVVYVNQFVYKYKGTAPNGTNITINDGTKSILTEAFIDCKGLSEIIIPSSVHEIGNQAFKGCTNLQNAVIGDSIGEQHTQIGNEAFSGCTSLTSVTIGNSVSWIYSRAFQNCNNLSDVYIFDLEAWLRIRQSDPLSLTHLYLNGHKIVHLVIPNTINGVRDYAFYGCRAIKSIDIPSTVSRIGEKAFYNCDSIASIICRASDPPSFNGSSYSSYATFTSFNATVQVPQDFLSDYQSDSNWSKFSNIIGFNDRFTIDGINYIITSTNTVSVMSNSLEYENEIELTLPEQVDFEGITYSVTAINDEAFRDCYSLKRVVIPNTVITIGNSAFESCGNLNEVIIGNSVVSIGNSAFENCQYLNHVTLGNSVVSIGNYAFSHNNPIPGYEYEPSCELIIPSSVESIGNNAFSNWYHLTSINLNSVKTIGGGAFSNCSQLTKVILGSDVTSIGPGAFACRYEYDWLDPNLAECLNNLTLDIICIAPVPPTCVNILVSDIMLDKTRLFVLPESVDDYMSAQVWCDIPECYPLDSDCSSYDFMVDGICYRLNEYNDHEVTVVRFEYYPYLSYGVPFYSGDITIPEVVNYGGQDYTVTSIESTFANTSISSISLPSSITRIDDHAFSECTYLRSVHLPNTITEIGGYAFNKCTNLTDINIPSSLDGLGDRIFYQCESLTSIYIPASISYFGAGTFDGCSSLSHIEVSSENGTFDSRDNSNAIIETATNTLVLGCKNTVIPNSVTRIGDYAFSGCTGLTGIYIPNSVTTIESNAFSGCSGLTSVNIHDITAWFNINFGNNYSNPLNYAHHLYLNGYEVTDMTIPNTVTTIGNYVFIGCSGLTGVTIPNSITSIGSSAFAGCTGLASVTIPNSVTTIGDGAFSGCNGLTSIEIPNSVTSIGDGAFSGCSGLTSIEIPNSVTSIGGSAFNYCSNLADINVPNSVVSIGSNAFSSTKWYNNQPDGLVYAGRVAYKFKGTMPTDTSIIIRNGIVSISPEAFYYNKRLIGIIFPASLKSIGGSAFRGCSGLTSVVLPDSITSIDGYAFSSCTGLSTVTCLATTPPAMDYDVFSNSTYSSATLRVPMTSVSAYKATKEWKRFTNVVGIINIGDIIEVDSIYYQINEGNVVTVVSRGEGNNPYSGDIVIPDYIDYDGVRYIVTSISEQAFQDCDELTSISMCNSLTSIGSHAFDGCAALGNIIIPDSVLTIGTQAFQGCTGLTNVTIGCCVTSIGTKAFNYCNTLRTVTCKNEIPPLMESSNCFTNTTYNNATLRVPRLSLETYQTTDYWFKFAKIEPIADLGDVNGDGYIAINDVTNLIDILLSGGDIPAGADVNGDGDVSIKDVTDLIDILLSGN